MHFIFSHYTCEQPRADMISLCCKGVIQSCSTSVHLWPWSGSYEAKKHLFLLLLLLLWLPPIILDSPLSSLLMESHPQFVTGTDVLTTIYHPLDLFAAPATSSFASAVTPVDLWRPVSPHLLQPAGVWLLGISSVIHCYTPPPPVYLPLSLLLSDLSIVCLGRLHLGGFHASLWGW